MELLAKERNEVALAFSRDVERSRTGSDHVAVPLMREIDTNGLERAAVQLRFPALVCNKQRVDDGAPVAFQREEVPIRHHFGTLRKLRL